MRNILIYILASCLFGCKSDFQDLEGIVYTNKELDLKNEISSQCLSTIRVKTTHGLDTMSLTNLLNNDSGKLFFLFSDFQCISCIKQELSILEIKNLKREVILLANFKSARSLKILLKDFEFMTLSILSGLPTNLENFSNPLYFLNTEANVIDNIMIPVYGDTARSSLYLDEVLDY